MIRATPAASIIPMPTHHIDQHGRMCGFSFACPGESPISALPLSRNTFFGHTACECDANSSEIVRLLSDVEWAKRKMDGFMKGVRERANVMPLATFSCKPDNAEGYVREGNIAGETMLEGCFDGCVLMHNLNLGQTHRHQDQAYCRLQSLGARSTRHDWHLPLFCAGTQPGYQSSQTLYYCIWWMWQGFG